MSKRLYPERPGEKIGGGHFVFKRHPTGRVNPGPVPYEHPNAASALREAKRLHQPCSSLPQ